MTSARPDVSAWLLDRGRLAPLLVLLVAFPAMAQEQGGCFIDRIDGTFVTGGHVDVVGWAADPSLGSPVPKIEILLDGKIPGESRRGEWRPDVLSHFSRPDFLWAGWTGRLSLEAVPPGVHSVEVYAMYTPQTRVPCGRSDFQVKPFPEPPERPAWRIGAEILVRTAAFLLWLGVVGLTPALLLRAIPIFLSAPLIGLSLFAIVAETGAALHVRPLYSAAFLTLLSGALGFVVPRGRWRGLRLEPTTVRTIASALVFLLLAVIPLASHGEGAVLGDIDDGIRECTVADSIARDGWRLPANLRVYPAMLRPEMVRGRRGGFLVLAALAQGFRSRAHEVYSVALLAAGCLVVLGTGLLAFRVLRRFRGNRWMAPAFVAINSTLFTTLYSQHVANVFAAGLILLFLTQALRLVRTSRPEVLVAAALPIAAGWSLYPEVMPTWAVAAGLIVMIASGFRERKRAAVRFVLTFVAAAALNPVGSIQVVQSWSNLAREPALSSPYGRLTVGDTHYFPSLAVITGILPHRLDAPAPIGPLRSLLAPVATVLVLFVSLLGWSQLARRQRWLTAALLAPIALALYATHRIAFPYGYAKFLLLAVPLWLISFVLVASTVGHRPRASWQRAAAVLSVALVAMLSLASTRQVVTHALRWVPSYDPAWRSLPALARAVGHDTVFRIDEPSKARQIWLLYFLSDNPVDLTPGVRYPGARYVRLVDRRRATPFAGTPIVSSRYFSVVPISEKQPKS